jgi:hypothetical protein
MNKRQFLFSLSATIAGASAAADSPPADLSFDAWHRRTADALKGLERDPDRLTDVQIGDLGAQLRSREPAIVLPAIFTGSLRGFFQQLKWWTAGNIEADVRVAIVALHELSAPEPEPHLGYFAMNAERFAESERVPRLAEIALVRTHRAAFASAFHAAIAKNPSKNPRVIELRAGYDRQSRSK